MCSLLMLWFPCVVQEEPITGFKVSSYLEFMEGLERRYRAMVLSDMRSILHKHS